MSFTRFHDDPARIKKQMEEISYTGRYMLDTPGPGSNLPFLEDPNIRLQKWGANLRNDKTNLESSLRNLGIPLNRDRFEYQKMNSALDITYQNENPFVDETRSSHPVWMFRELEQSRWENPFVNPQSHVEIKCANNVNTRLQEKDDFTRRKI
jgi:hypothetical protein